MSKTFPHITHISHVLPAIEGRSEFSFGQRSPHFDLVAYYLLASDTFKSDVPGVADLRRECRGLLFHKDGRVARRAFHKFFNVGETEETMPENLDLSQPHMILEKLDGSMVGPFISGLDGEIYWASMRGSEDYHRRLQALYKGSRFEDVVRAADAKGLTAIFEYCSPDNRIVVEYTEPKMTLLAMRYRETGIYASRKEVESMAKSHGIPVVRPLDLAFTAIEPLMDYVKSVQNMEGAVLWFEDGRLAKLKGEWYQQLHKLLGYFEYEKDIARLILSGNQDDLLAILSKPRQLNLTAYQDALMAGVKSVVANCEDLSAHISEQGMERKAFAISDLTASSVIKSVIFRNFDKLGQANFTQDIVAAALTKTGSHGNWESFKQNVGLDLHWNPEPD